MGELFRDVMDGFEENLPNRVWENVSSELKNTGKRKRALIYYSIAASVALIIAFGTGYFMALNNNKQPQYSNTNINNVPPKPLIESNSTLKTDKIVNTQQNTTPEKSEKKFKKTTLPPKVQSNNAFAFQQNTKIVIQDTTIVAKDAVLKPRQDLMAGTTENKLKTDTNSLQKPFIDIYKNLKIEDLKSKEIFNKNQNTVNTIIPKEKTPIAEETFGKWSLAEQFSPVGYMGNTQKGALADAVSYGYSGSNQAESQTISDKRILLVYATGMTFKYQLSNKWGLKSGVFYATGELGAGQQHKQLEVPVMANYSLINKKFIWGLNSGFGTNLLFTEGGRSINYSGLLGTEIGYNISKKIALTIEPTIKYNFSYPYDYIFHYYPVSLAVYTGLSYRF